MQEKEEILCIKEAFFTLPIQQSNSDPNVIDAFFKGRIHYGFHHLHFPSKKCLKKDLEYKLLHLA